LRAALLAKAERYARWLESDPKEYDWPERFECRCCGANQPYLEQSLFERCEACGQAWHRQEGGSKWMTPAEIGEALSTYHSSAHAASAATAQSRNDLCDALGIRRVH
jgi:hypothetical protein